MSGERLRACGLADLRPGEAHQVVVDGHPIAVVRCGEDESLWSWQHTAYTDG